MTTVIIGHNFRMERLYTNHVELVMKYTSQGEGHGHFDKLSFSLYSNGEEVVQDYGFARFVNIDQKNGGGYLKENTQNIKRMNPLMPWNMPGSVLIIVRNGLRRLTSGIIM